MMKEFEELWDNEIKALAEDVMKTCVSDSLVKHHIGQMIFYVEHDLADRRETVALRLYPCVGVFNDEAYYDLVHKNTPREEIEKLRNLGKKLKELEDTLGG